MRICCNSRCYLTVHFFYVSPVKPSLQTHLPFLLGTLSQFFKVFFLTTASNKPDNSTEKHAKVPLIAFSGSEPFRCHFQMLPENKFPESGVSLTMTLISQAKQSIFWQSEPQYSPESQHIKKHVGGSRFLAAIVLKEVDCCSLNQTASAFLCFKRSLCSFKCRRRQLYRLEVKAMRSSPPLRDGSSF